MDVSICMARGSVARRRVRSVRLPLGRTNSPSDTMQPIFSARVASALVTLWWRLVTRVFRKVMHASKWVELSLSREPHTHVAREQSERNLEGGRPRLRRRAETKSALSKRDVGRELSRLRRRLAPRAQRLTRRHFWAGSMVLARRAAAISLKKMWDKVRWR